MPRSPQNWISLEFISTWRKGKVIKKSCTRPDLDGPARRAIVISFRRDLGARELVLSATTGRYSSHGVARVLTSAHGTNEHFSEHFRFRVSRLKEGLFPSCSCATTPRTAATTDRGHVSARLEGATLFEGARAQRNARRHVRVHRAPFPDDALIQVKQPILEVGPDHRPDGACKTR